MQGGGGGGAKEGLTFAFFANAAGSKEPPTVIGKTLAQEIRDLKKPEGIYDYSNPTACMNSKALLGI